MRASLCLALAASSLVSAIPFHQHSHSRSKRAAPSNPIQVAKHEYLCNVKSDLPLYRDLGFVGKIQDTVIYTYGDTLDNTTTSFFMVSDSSSIGTDDPCMVLNTQRTSDGSHPNNMVSPVAPWDESNAVDAFGGTNIVPVRGNMGAMFFLKNHRPNGDITIIGAGIADVFLLDDKNVSTFRLADYWWDAGAGEPWYGDITAYHDGTYIYGFGHGRPDHKYVYVTRAPVAQYGFLESWEYWDGSTSSWTKTRQHNPSIAQGLQWNDADGPAWAIAQGQMIWSEYYKKIMWVYGLDWADDDAGNFGVYARTADSPTGPWSAATHLYSVMRLASDRSVYAMVANPYFDDSGKTLVVTVDNGPDTVQATKVTFQ